MKHSLLKKNVLLGTFLCASLVIVQAQSAGIHFFEGSWNSVVTKAKQEKKAIFVDAYASWCGPCKYMKKTVFTNTEVGKFYNQNFINFAIDWEKEEARPLHGKYPLRAFPTLLFFNPTTEQVVAVAEGALDVTNLIAFGNYGLNMLRDDNKKIEDSKKSTAPSKPSTKPVPPKEKGVFEKVSSFFKSLFS
ncbi:hypothetical protein FACS189452_06380 [Bacteroidia bacterium]|nr:hypothetical protein FACS189452_06380 [Bacteroidia bacterium]